MLKILHLINILIYFHIFMIISIKNDFMIKFNDFFRIALIISTNNFTINNLVM